MKIQLIGYLFEVRRHISYPWEITARNSACGASTWAERSVVYKPADGTDLDWHSV